MFYFVHFQYKNTVSDKSDLSALLNKNWHRREISDSMSEKHPRRTDLGFLIIDTELPFRAPKFR